MSLRWLLRRLVAILVGLVFTTVLVYALIDLSPGGPATALLGGKPATPQALQAIDRQYHLNRPFLDQYWLWLQGAVQGNFNESVVAQQPVSVVIAQRFPVTAELALYGFVIMVVIGIPLGMFAGVRRGRLADRGITTAALISFSVPSFAAGTVLLYVFAVDLGWFPVLGAGSGLSSRLVHLTLPAVTFALASAAFVIRQTRAAALELSSQDYITFARARGLGPGRIWARYLLRSASLPILTMSGLLLAAALGGVVLIEQTFSLPGLGSLLVSSVENKDVPVIQALAVLGAVLVAVTLLVVDLLAFVLDPRLRVRR